MDILLIILLILLINTYLVKVLIQNSNIPSEKYLWLLFAVHFLMTMVYILYAYATRSDSFSYYNKTESANAWFDLLEYGTSFIQFLAWPFIKIINLSYLAMMILFSYFGYLAILLFYIAIAENVDLKPIFGKLSSKELIFLLPNIHFWSSSLGKGSVIVFGLGLFCYSLSRFNRRYITLILGSLIIFFVRPHILFSILASIFTGILITTKGISSFYKWFIIAITLVLFFNLSNEVLKYTNTDSFDFMSSNSLSHRTDELTKASSGIDIQNYNIFMKLFAFWFRPLFLMHRVLWEFLCQSRICLSSTFLFS